MNKFNETPSNFHVLLYESHTRTAIPLQIYLFQTQGSSFSVLYHQHHPPPLSFSENDIQSQHFVLIPKIGV